MITMIAVLATVAIIDSMPFVSCFSVSFGETNYGNLLAIGPRFEPDCLASLAIDLSLLFSYDFACGPPAAGDFQLLSSS